MPNHVKCPECTRIKENFTKGESQYQGKCIKCRKRTYKQIVKRYQEMKASIYAHERVGLECIPIHPIILEELLSLRAKIGKTARQTKNAIDRLNRELLLKKTMFYDATEIMKYIEEKTPDPLPIPEEQLEVKQPFHFDSSHIKSIPETAEMFISTNIHTPIRITGVAQCNIRKNRQESDTSFDDCILPKSRKDIER